MLLLGVLVGGEAFLHVLHLAVHLPEFCFQIEIVLLGLALFSLCLGQLFFFLLQAGTLLFYLTLLPLLALDTPAHRFFQTLHLSSHLF